MTALKQKTTTLPKLAKLLGELRLSPGFASSKNCKFLAEPRQRSMLIGNKEMSNRITFVLVLTFSILIMTIVLSGCAKPAEAPRPEEPSPPQPTDATLGKIEKAPSLPPPKPEEVTEVIKRVFQNAMTTDAGRSQKYILGDFNGDGSQDIAIVVGPADGSLDDINSEVANWIREDPHKIILPDPHKSVQELPPGTGPVVVLQGEVLLAVVHGYGPEGWRNPLARQTYLLKNAVGSNMTRRPIKELTDSARGREKQPKLTPVMIANGEVIKEVFGGESGFLYYTGARYAWYQER